MWLEVLDTECQYSAWAFVMMNWRRTRSWCQLPVAAIRRTNGREEGITLRFIGLSVFDDFASIRFLHGIRLIFAQARVRVWHADIENKRAGCRRQSDKDISLMFAVSVLGHN